MPPRKCCCDEGCLIFADGFDRADNPSLGANWTEYPTTAFEINSNRVRSVDSGNAICNVIHPTPSGSMVVTIETVDEHSGDVYDILLNVKDHMNYHRARFYRNSPTTSQIELAIVVGGSASVLKTETILSLTGTARNFSALIADHEFCASVEFGLVSLTWANTTLIAGGYYSGFGTPIPSGLLMDNFTFGHHLQTKPLCPSCVCQCLDHYVAPRLNVHLEGAPGGRMQTLNCDFEITWDRVNNYWQGSATCCTVFWNLILNCNSDWSTFSLFNSSISCFGGGPQTWAPTNGGCNPFFLEFGPFFISSTGDLACSCDGHTFPEAGSYTITITEIP